MLVVIVGMLVALLVAGAVLAAVVVPARREGREFLTAEGEEIVADLRERTADAALVAKDKAVAATEVVKEKAVAATEAVKDRVDTSDPVDLRDPAADRSAERAGAHAGDRETPAHGA